MENERIRIFFERQKEQILAEVGTEIQKYEFQADSYRRSIQELSGIIESQRRENDHTVAGDEQLRRDQLLLQEHLLEQNWDLREAHMKSLIEMEELRRVQELRVDESSKRILIENQDTFKNSRPKFRNYRMKSIVWMTREILKDAESVRCGPSLVPSQPALLPPYRDPGGTAKQFCGNAEPQR